MGFCRLVLLPSLTHGRRFDEKNKDVQGECTAHRFAQIEWSEKEHTNSEQKQVYVCLQYVPMHTPRVILRLNILWNEGGNIGSAAVIQKEICGKSA